MLAPGERGGVGRDARRGAAQHQDGPCPFRQPAGHGRRVVARDAVLLERGRFLFVDRDQPKTRQRREDRGARPDHDVSLAAPDPPPLGGPFRLGQGAVQHGQPARKTRRKTPNRLRRERDLGHQHQALAAAGQHRLEQGQVDLGLAASRDAVQKENLRLLAGERDGNPLPDRFLRRFERDRPGHTDLSGLSQDAALPASLDRFPDDRANAGRHDGPDHFIERHQVMRGDQTGELDERGREHRLCVDQGLDRFELEDGWPLIKRIDKTGHGPLPEGHPDPVPHFDQAGQRLRDGVVEEPRLASDARLDGDMRDRPERLRRRGSDRHRSHPRCARPPRFLTVSAPRRRRPMASRW